MSSYGEDGVSLATYFYVTDYVIVIASLFVWEYIAERNNNAGYPLCWPVLLS